MMKSIKETSTAHLKNVYTFVVDIVIIHPEISMKDWIRHALDSHYVLFDASVMLILFLIQSNRYAFFHSHQRSTFDAFI